MSKDENKSPQIDEKLLEKIFQIVSHYTFSEIEEVVPFDSKNDEQREEIMKVAVKSIETSIIILNELASSPSDFYNSNKIDLISNYLLEQKFDEAYKALRS